MIEKNHFIKEIEIEITAASIGINRDDWYCSKPGVKRQEIISVMKSNKYDIVPIINKSGNLTEYFTLNDGALVTNELKSDDKIYYLTHVRDLIWSMIKNQKIHYFLTNGRDNNDIVGLVSLSNFNSKDFYIYLFNAISYLEIEFASLIESTESDAMIILRSVAEAENSLEQIDEIFKRIENDRKYNIDNDFKEYLYLSNLVTLIKHEQKFKNLNYNSIESFEKNIGIIRKMRNCVAHPVKSLVRDLSDLQKINKGIDKIFELKERLESIKYYKI